MTVDDATAAATLLTLFGVLTTAVMNGKTSVVDADLRGRQRHPRRGVRRDFSRGVKMVAKPWGQLPLAAATSGALRRCGVPGASAVVVAATSAFLADKACKQCIRRDRPPGYRGREKDESFPSGHTASTAALTLTVARLLEREGAVRSPFASVGALLLTGLVAETRLILDEHWPSDLIAGALLGGAVAFGALALSDRLTRRQHAPPRPRKHSALRHA